MFEKSNSPCRAGAQFQRQMQSKSPINPHLSPKGGGGGGGGGGAGGVVGHAIDRCITAT